MAEGDGTDKYSPIDLLQQSIIEQGKEVGVLETRLVVLDHHVYREMFSIQQTLEKMRAQLKFLENSCEELRATLKQLIPP